MEKCKICSSNSPHFATSQVLFKYEVKYYCCSNCGFLQTEEPYWLDQAYTQAIATSDIGIIYRNNMMADVTAKLIFNFFDHNAKFLDFGGGYGIFVRLMRDQGFDFYWQDKFCQNIFAKSFEWEAKGSYNLNLVTAFELFEHLVNPVQELEEIIKLSPNVLFSTVLLPDPVPKLNEWGYYATHEGQHISLYTQKSLEILAAKYNLRLYTDGQSLHLITSNKSLPENLFELIQTGKTISPQKESLLARDFYQVVNNLSLQNQSLINEQPTQTETNRTSNLSIIIDAVFFQLYQTGIARVWLSLLDEWADSEFSQHILVLDRANTAPKIPGIRYRNVPRLDYSDLEGDRQMLQQICEEEGADLFISSYYTTPITTPSVFMAYDMIPEVFDWDLSTPMWLQKHYAIQHASAYITISENTAHDLTQLFSNVSIESVTVAHCGVKNPFSFINEDQVNAFRIKYGINKPFFLLVGASYGNSYKNTLLFLQAYSHLATKQGFDIVITGHGGNFPAECRKYTKGSTVHTLLLSDQELAAAYSAALALVYPSKYEGFGMPILEAMACGCPVITCPNSSIPEVAGEAALYIKDDDVEGLANALCEIQKPGIRQHLIQAGIEQSKKFPWSKTATTIGSVLIKETLKYLNLRNINLIIFPNWKTDQESLGLELVHIIKAIANHSRRSEITLLIFADNTDQEEANLLLSDVGMYLLMEEELEIPEDTQISLVGKLERIQWEELITRLQGRVILGDENTEVIVKSVITLKEYLIKDLDSSAFFDLENFKPEIKISTLDLFQTKEYKVGNHKILLPLDHLLDQYQARWKRYDTVLGNVAQIVFEKYPNASAIDIGANVGDSAALINKYINIPILCVEGYPKFIPFLEYNAVQIGNVQVAPYFIGNDGESIPLEKIISTGGTASITTNDIKQSLDHQLGNQISVMSLDTITKLYPKFQAFKLLKIDTDGYDFEIISRSIDIIRLLKPVICFEYDISFKPSGEIESLEAIENLLNADYSYFLIYDNFGNYLINLTAQEYEKFIDLNTYLLCNRSKSGKVAVYYFDVYAFHTEDYELFCTVRNSEIYC